MLWASLTYYDVGYRFVIYWCYYLERCSFCCQGFFFRTFIMKTYWILSKPFSVSPSVSICKVGTGYKAKEELMWRGDLGGDRPWIQYVIRCGFQYQVLQYSFPGSRCLIHPWVLLCKVRPQVPVIHLGKLQESGCHVVPFPGQSFLVLATPLVPLQSLALTRSLLTDYCVRLRWAVFLSGLEFS